MEVVVTSLTSNCDFDLYHSIPIQIFCNDNILQEIKGLICNGIILFIYYLYICNHFPLIFFPELQEEQAFLSFLQTKIGTSQSSVDPHSFFTAAAQALQTLLQTHIRNQTPLFVRIYYHKSSITPVAKGRILFHFHTSHIL